MGLSHVSGLSYDPAAEAALPVVENGVLAAGDSRVGALKGHRHRVGLRIDKAAGRSGAVAQLALQFGPLRRPRDPVEALDAELPALPGVGGVAVGDVHEVALEVLGDDVPRAAAEAEAEALADGVEPVPLVPAELAAAPLLEDGPLPFPEAAATNSR